MSHAAALPIALDKGAGDARWFLGGFAGAALLVLAPATFETLRTIDPARVRAARATVEARTS